METGKRNSVIDIYKGIGIVLVLMGHIGFGASSSYISHAFHMPMFFFISGYLYHRNTEDGFWAWVKKKARTLLAPYCVFGVLNYLFWMLIQFQKGENISIAPIIHLLFENTTGLASGSLWFLTAIFFANVCFGVVDRYIKNPVWKGVLVVLVANIGIFAAEYFPFRLPYAMDAGMVGVGLFYAGYLLKKYEDKKLIHHLLHMPLWELVISIALLCFLIYQHDEINMRTGAYNNIFLFWVNAIGGSVLIYNVAVQLNKLRKYCALFDWVLNLGERIGRHSLWYVCMNDLINVELLFLMGAFVTRKSSLITAVTHSLVLLLAVAVIELIIKYTPVRKLVRGR